MSTIPAIYENGVFRPLGPVDLPEKCEVEVIPKREPEPVSEIDFSDEARAARNLDAVYEILSHRHRSGRSDLSERHNEMEDASWIAGVNQAWAEDWDDPREDIYTIHDGEPGNGIPVDFRHRDGS